MIKTVYNEELYLQGDEQVLASFYKLQEQRKKRYDAEQDIFKEELEKYDEFITMVAEFIKKMGYTTPLQISITLSYLIENGYLSQNLEFKDHSPVEEFEIMSSYGTTILRGEGCCRNYSKMHKDIMDKLSLYCKPFYCFQRNSIFESPKNSSANHVLNLIEYDANVYGIDLYNNSNLFYFKKPLVLRIVSTTTNYELRYKPYYEIIMGESNIQDIQRTISLFENLSSREIVNPFDYEDKIRFSMVRELQDRTDEMYRFHEKTKTLKKELVNDITHKMFI